MWRDIAQFCAVRSAKLHCTPQHLPMVLCEMFASRPSERGFVLVATVAVEDFEPEGSVEGRQGGIISCSFVCS